MNPYASQLGSQDPIGVLSSTSVRLAELSSAIGESRLNQPRAPGKWSPREILVHLADCELAFGFRYRQALAEENHTLQPFNQDQWAKSYSAFTTKQALQT